MLRSAYFHQVMINTAQALLEDLTSHHPDHWTLEEKLENTWVLSWLEFVRLIGL